MFVFIATVFSILLLYLATIMCQNDLIVYGFYLAFLLMGGIGTEIISEIKKGRKQ